MLALAEGRSYRQIMSSLQTIALTISRWKQRFEQAGLDRLDTLHKGSEPRVHQSECAIRVWRLCIKRFGRTKKLFKMLEVQVRPGQRQSRSVAVLPSLLRNPSSKIGTESKTRLTPPVSCPKNVK